MNPTGTRVACARSEMGEPTDTETLTADLMKALQLLARDAVASALAAGTMPGTDGLALQPRLTEIAAAELADLERLAARIASLGGSPSVTLKKLDPPQEADGTLEWLAAMQREGNDAVVAAIPADADDAEGEATEHLLEHIVARKRDVIELLDRALR
jgi:hypothetical protein